MSTSTACQAPVRLRPRQPPLQISSPQQPGSEGGSYLRICGRTKRQKLCLVPQLLLLLRGLLLHQRVLQQQQQQQVLLLPRVPQLHPQLLPFSWDSSCRAQTARDSGGLGSSGCRVLELTKTVSCLTPLALSAVP